MKIEHASNHADRRRGEYPSVGDQLDAIWKAFAAMDPAAVPEPARALLAQVQAVKEKYPAEPGR